jgi:hypothetical protein
VVRRVVDVRPVDQRRDARVEALQRAGQVGRVDVLGPVERGERVEHLDEVVVERRVGGAAADRRLPGVPVGVDEAGHDEEALGLDDLGVGADVRLDRDDLAVLDEDIGVGKVAQLRVNRQDVASVDECASHVRDSS